MLQSIHYNIKKAIIPRKSLPFLFSEKDKFYMFFYTTEVDLNTNSIFSIE